MSRLLGAQFQCPPLISAVKRQLRVRKIKTVELLDYDSESALGELFYLCFVKITFEWLIYSVF